MTGKTVISALKLWICLRKLQALRKTNRLWKTWNSSASAPRSSRETMTPLTFRLTWTIYFMRNSVCHAVILCRLLILWLNFIRFARMRLNRCWPTLITNTITHKLMKTYSTQNIRNVVLLGSTKAGKTHCLKRCFMKVRLSTEEEQ